ncbi:MAG TPA: alanine--tRNA ligase, partial [Syntrophomonas wolfei]|nr:alanine--tRNA ligase [Syntrophomonas wolfei]
YDTYGFPLDLTEDMAEENQFTLDKAGFDRSMEEQRQRARQANKGEDLLGQERLLSEKLAGIAPSSFTGYENSRDESVLLAIIKGSELMDKALNAEEVILITSRTP